MQRPAAPFASLFADALTFLRSVSADRKGEGGQPSNRSIE